MDQKKIKTLRLIEALEKEDSQSQRELSSKLNISLGLVNSFIRRFVKKGYFKITSLPKSRIRYILTPTGMAEKTRLTSQYLLHSIKYYKDSQHILKKIFNNLDNAGITNIVFYGACEMTEIAYTILKETNQNLLSIVDDAKAGETMFGTSICQEQDLSTLLYDAILIMTVEKDDEIRQRLERLGIPDEKIFTIVNSVS